MDAAFFLRLRTRFIRRYYLVGVGSFLEIQRKISAEETPYDVLPASFDPEYGEPAFLEEWAEAENAMQIVGRSAVSLLSDTLKLYFLTLEQQLGFHLSSQSKAIAKKEGFIVAYKNALGELLETDWTLCPVRFNIIEQIVLARNRSQHGGDLSTLGAWHDSKTLTKHCDLIFASEEELKVWVDNGANPDTLLAPRLRITQENLDAVIAEVEKLADWIEERMRMTGHAATVL